MKDKTRVAIIGCGVIGPLHAECFNANDDAEVVWVCDLISEKAQQLAEKTGSDVKWTTNYKDVLNADDVDAVSVCTDHASHADIFVESLEHGKDTLCEKPLAQNSENLDKMLAAKARHPERICGGVFQHRFDPIYVELHDIISSGALGTLLNANTQLRCYRSDSYYTDTPWRGTWKDEGGSVLINQAIHYIDQLLWHTGGVDKIKGTVKNIAHRNVIETEDCAAAFLEFKCGAVGTIEVTSASHLDWFSRISFFGTDGSIEITGDKQIFVKTKDKEQEDLILKRLEAALEPIQPAVTGKKYYGPGHFAQVADFIEAVRERREPSVTLESAAETLRAVFAIYDTTRQAGQ
jgi:UDP-N-acetyl-2-amino-2-deoxyglucuronate dehydrogenase